MSTYFYTVNLDGVEYAAALPVYQWKKVTEILELPKELISRGADSKLPYLTGDILRTYLEKHNGA